MSVLRVNSGLLLAISVSILTLLGLVLGCSDSFTGNQNELTNDKASKSINGMTFYQYLVSDFVKGYDYDKILTFVLGNINVVKSADIKPIILLFVDNIQSFVDDEELHKKIVNACELYGIALDDINWSTTEEIVQNYFDVRSSFGGLNLFSPEVGQTVSNFRSSFLDEKSFTSDDIANLDNVFDAITIGTNTIEDILTLLYASQNDISLSNSYLTFVESAISSFELYRKSKEELSSYFGISCAVLELIASSDIDNETQTILARFRLYFEISDDGWRAGIEVAS